MLPFKVNGPITMVISILDGLEGKVTPLGYQLTLETNQSKIDPF